MAYTAKSWALRAYNRVFCLSPPLVHKGGCNKKWTGRLNTKFSVNIGPTETYYIPNQWKLNENFAELCRLEIAALIG